MAPLRAGLAILFLAALGHCHPSEFEKKALSETKEAIKKSETIVKKDSYDDWHAGDFGKKSLVEKSENSAVPQAAPWKRAIDLVMKRAYGHPQRGPQTKKDAVEKKEVTLGETLKREEELLKRAYGHPRRGPQTKKDTVEKKEVSLGETLKREDELLKRAYGHPRRGPQTKKNTVEKKATLGETLKRAEEKLAKDLEGLEKRVYDQQRRSPAGPSRRGYGQPTKKEADAAAEKKRTSDPNAYGPPSSSSSDEYYGPPAWDPQDMSSEEYGPPAWGPEDDNYGPPSGKREEEKRTADSKAYRSPSVKREEEEVKRTSDPSAYGPPNAKRDEQKPAPQKRTPVLKRDDAEAERELFSRFYYDVKRDADDDRFSRFYYDMKRDEGGDRDARFYYDVKRDDDDREARFYYDVKRDDGDRDARFYY